MVKSPEDLISLDIDQEAVRVMLQNQIEETIKELDLELVFWDTAELKRKTCMSWNTILKYFFYDKRFLKFKVGAKWYFPAQETKEFLNTWIKEQK